MPTPYTMKFIIMVWLAFLARQRPVSTMAKPACMNMTRKPVTSVQTKLIAILFWPTWFTTSPIVRPFFASATATSDYGAGQRAVGIALDPCIRLGRLDVLYVGVGDRDGRRRRRRSRGSLRHSERRREK